MPYRSVRELPPAVKTALKTQRERDAFRKAFNAALQRGLSEEQAFKVAYNAARMTRRADRREKATEIGCGLCEREFVLESAFLSHVITVHGASEEQAREFSTKRRSKLADENKALPDGSYPIVTVEDLRNAIRAFGRAPESRRAQVKAHIKRRARALGAVKLLPESWRD